MRSTEEGMRSLYSYSINLEMLILGEGGNLLVSRKIIASVERARFPTEIRCSSVRRMKKLMAVQMNEKPVRTQPVG